MRHNILGGYGVYFVLTGLALLALLLAVQLPVKTWASEKLDELEALARETDVNDYNCN